MAAFRQWLESEDSPDAMIQVDGAEIGYNIVGTTAVIVSFNRLRWQELGVIDKVIKAVRRHSGFKRVTTDPGIRDHWSHAGYDGA